MSERVYTWSEALKGVADLRIPLGRLFSHGQKRYREQLVAAIFTCAMTKLTGRTDWYLRVVEIDPPDFELWCARYPDRIYKIENLQVPEASLNLNKNITGQVYNILVDKKLKKYGNPSKYILCVYLRFNGPFNFSDMRNKFQQSPPSFGQIWISAAINKELTTWHCEEVWPGSQMVKIELIEELKKYGKTLHVKSLGKGLNE